MSVLMLKFKFKALLAEKEFEEGRSITIQEVSEITGVNRMTLSKLANHKGHNASSDVIDKLCDYFECPIQDLVEHIPNSNLSA
jgi:DNA-binding Xre family transcriptional regulator